MDKFVKREKRPRSGVDSTNAIAVLETDDDIAQDVVAEPLAKRSTHTAHETPVVPSTKTTDEDAPASSSSAPCRDLPLAHLLSCPKWATILTSLMSTSMFSSLNDKLAAYAVGNVKSTPVFPKREHVFNAFHYTPWESLKVVLIGQDPYHGPLQAHGLCFSVLPGVPIPPSLRNIYKELTSDVPSFKAPAHGCLVEWARRGVLLLNAALTVESGNPNSHAAMWAPFTDGVIKLISKRHDPVVFVLWGGFAKKKKDLIDRSKHKIVESGHPSPLSVKHFLGTKPFSRTNDALKELGLEPIDWSLSTSPPSS